MTQVPPPTTILLLIAMHTICAERCKLEEQNELASLSRWPRRISLPDLQSILEASKFSIKFRYRQAYREDVYEYVQGS